MTGGLGSGDDRRMLVGKMAVNFRTSDPRMSGPPMVRVGNMADQ